jgi:hypothetical protein
LAIQERLATQVTLALQAPLLALQGLQEPLETLEPQVILVTQDRLVQQVILVLGLQGQLVLLVILVQLVTRVLIARLLVRQGQLVLQVL